MFFSGMLFSWCLILVVSFFDIGFVGVVKEVVRELFVEMMYL